MAIQAHSMRWISDNVNQWPQVACRASLASLPRRIGAQRRVEQSSRLRLRETEAFAPELEIDGGHLCGLLPSTPFPHGLDTIRLGPSDRFWRWCATRYSPLYLSQIFVEIICVSNFFIGDVSILFNHLKISMCCFDKSSYTHNWRICQQEKRTDGALFYKPMNNKRFLMDAMGDEG